MGDGERGEKKVEEIEGKQGDDGDDKRGKFRNGATRIGGRLRRGTARIKGGLGGRLRNGELMVMMITTMVLLFGGHDFRVAIEIDS